MPFNETTPALSNALIDGATVPIAQLFDVGIGRLTTFHYLLPTSTAPLALVMDRKRFEQLPANAQALIGKYSGEWAANEYNAAYGQFSKESLAQIKADARRTVVTPTAADRKKADDDFKSVQDRWAAENRENGKLLSLVQLELATLRHPGAAPRAQSKPQ